MSHTRAEVPAPIDTGTTRYVHLLVFELEDYRIALAASAVREVVRAVAISPLPHAPPVIEGVINARGALVPVFDLRQRFGLPPRPLSPDQHLIFAFAGPRVVALRVDRAADFLTVAEADIESATRIAPGSDDATAVARLPDGLVVIQDLDRFLSPAEAEQVDAILSGQT
jgi:purine-binding chemotaxis protein CheW